MNLLNKIKHINNKKNKKMSKYLSNKKSYYIDFLKIGPNNQLRINENNKQLIIGDYNFSGIYQPLTKLWIWASSIPGINNKHIDNITFIRSFSHLFKANDDIKYNFYYQLLTQDTILIQNESMLGWINELILYLSDDLYIFNPKNSELNIQFITLKNMKELFI